MNCLLCLLALVKYTQGRWAAQEREPVGASLLSSVRNPHTGSVY